MNVEALSLLQPVAISGNREGRKGLLKFCDIKKKKLVYSLLMHLDLYHQNNSHLFLQITYNL